jgi:hypothetical protein
MSTISTIDVSTTEQQRGDRLGLFERLLQEKEDEERRRGRPLGQFYGLDSPALHRGLVNAPKDRPKYGADLRKLHRYINKGVHSPVAAMQFTSLKRKYEKEYTELKAEGRGQKELL